MVRTIYRLGPGGTVQTGSDASLIQWILFILLLINYNDWIRSLIVKRPGIEPKDYEGFAEEDEYLEVKKPKDVKFIKV